MSVRVVTNLELQIGRDNQLQDLIADQSISEVFDTLDHATVYETTLAPGEANHQVALGDITQIRLLYVRSDQPITLSPAGGLATAAQLVGAGGTYNTAFMGGETLDVDVDGTSLAVVFDAADQTLAQVINRINSFAALAGIRDSGGDPAVVAFDVGSQLALRSPTVGDASLVDITAGTALATLGLSVTSNTGVNATAGQSPLVLQRPALTDVSVFAFMTLQSSGITLTNNSSDTEARVLVALAGDLLSNPPSAC